MKTVQMNDGLGYNLPLPIGRGAQCVHWAERVPSQSKIKDFCQLSQRESQDGDNLNDHLLGNGDGKYDLAVGFLPFRDGRDTGKLDFLQILGQIV